MLKQNKNNEKTVNIIDPVLRKMTFKVSCLGTFTSAITGVFIRFLTAAFISREIPSMAIAKLMTE